MTAQKQRNESSENIRIVYTEKLVNRNQNKISNNRTQIQRNKENVTLSPLWTRQSIKVQKSVALVKEDFATTFHSPVRNAHISMLSLHLLLYDEYNTIQYKFIV